jgi:preprotein translocase subunit SecA
MAGRGVDILLGGNPEGLARDEAVARGLELESEEAKAAYAELLKKFTEQCEAEGDQVRQLGGLYVLGSERHESRRIDNQLRGRAGRQGDPGKSRFFLSLEDELMQLFATGAVSWVMERALPEDAPIETRMVTRAIERAQNTVEAKNAEIRKDLLKYDEVYNEQRKAVYARRLQVIDGQDLRQYTEDLLSSAIGRLVADCCPTDYSEEWDLPRLIVETTKYYPTKFTAEDLEEAASSAQIAESLLTEAYELYEEREQSFPGGEKTARQIERNLMLQIIDQRWRQHLVELDYLREGIHLRGLAQTDPLNAWQKEGYEMFERLWEAVDDDYLQYVMHIQVNEAAEDLEGEELLEQVAAAEELGGPAPLAGASYLGPSDPSDSSASVVESGAALRRQAERPPRQAGGLSVAALSARPEAAAGPERKLGRNDPCWCGSGRKYKLCHGAS